MANTQAVHPASSLRNEKTFPPFMKIVDDDNIYLTGVPELDYHSAYIGEIVDFVGFGRIVVIAKDKTGRQVNIAFYDDTRGKTFEQQIMKSKGNVVVVLYPKRYKFMDGSSGFRIENDDMKKIRFVPCTYKDLLAANDRYFAITNNPSVCANCNKKEAVINHADAASASSATVSTEDTGKKLQPCEGCKTVKYCNKECQSAHRTQHKNECRNLREVQWFTKKDWTFVDEDAMNGNWPEMFKPWF